MSWWIAAGVRGALTKTTVAVALIAMPWAGVAVRASADDLPTSPNDPKCATMSWYAACQGGPFAPQPPPAAPAGAPTGPLDPQCAAMAAEAACLGSPVLPPPPPPAQGLGGPPPLPPPPIAPPPVALAPIAPPPMDPPHIDMPAPDMGAGMPGHI